MSLSLPRKPRVPGNPVNGVHDAADKMCRQTRMSVSRSLQTGR